MRRCLRLAWGAGLCGLLLALAAHAEAPMATDDAGTMDVGRFKMESAAVFDARQRGAEFFLGWSPI